MWWIEISTENYFSTQHDKPLTSVKVPSTIRIALKKGSTTIGRYAKNMPQHVDFDPFVKLTGYKPVSYNSYVSRDMVSLNIPLINHEKKNYLIMNMKNPSGVLINGVVQRQSQVNLMVKQKVHLIGYKTSQKPLNEVGRLVYFMIRFQPLHIIIPTFFFSNTKNGLEEKEIKNYLSRIEDLTLSKVLQTDEVTDESLCCIAPSYVYFPHGILIEAMCKNIPVVTPLFLEDLIFSIENCQDFDFRHIKYQSHILKVHYDNSKIMNIYDQNNFILHDTAKELYSPFNILGHNSNLFSKKKVIILTCSSKSEMIYQIVKGTCAQNIDIVALQNQRQKIKEILDRDINRANSIIIYDSEKSIDDCWNGFLSIWYIKLIQSIIMGKEPEQVDFFEISCSINNHDKNNNNEKKIDIFEDRSIISQPKEFSASKPFCANFLEQRNSHIKCSNNEVIFKSKKEKTNFYNPLSEICSLESNSNGCANNEIYIQDSIENDSSSPDSAVKIYKKKQSKKRNSIGRFNPLALKKLNLSDKDKSIRRTPQLPPFSKGQDLEKKKELSNSIHNCSKRKFKNCPFDKENIKAKRNTKALFQRGVRPSKPATPKFEGVFRFSPKTIKAFNMN